MKVYLLIERWGYDPGVKAAYATRELAESARRAESVPGNYDVEDFEVIGLDKGPVIT